MPRWLKIIWPVMFAASWFPLKISSLFNASELDIFTSSHLHILLSNAAKPISSRVISTSLGWSLFNCIFNTSSPCQIRTTYLYTNKRSPPKLCWPRLNILVPHSTPGQPLSHLDWSTDIFPKCIKLPYCLLHRVVDHFIYQNWQPTHRPVKYLVDPIPHQWTCQLSPRVTTHLQPVFSFLAPRIHWPTVPKVPTIYLEWTRWKYHFASTSCYGIIRDQP